MQIIYAQNPLRTTVELDEFEKKELWYKTKIEEMRRIIYSASFSLKDGDRFNLQNAREILDTKRFYDSKDKKAEINERTDESYNEYLDALRDCHVGDCTCVAMSCLKCHAEDVLGINTIKGLGQHAAGHIHAAFDVTDGTIEAALDWLKNYEPKADWKGWEAHEDRWKAEAAQGYEWLLTYKQSCLLESKR